MNYRSNRPRSRTNLSGLFVRTRMSSPIRNTINLKDNTNETRGIEETIVFYPKTNTVQLDRKLTIFQRYSTVKGRPNMMLLKEMEQLDSKL